MGESDPAESSGARIAVHNQSHLESFVPHTVCLELEVAWAELHNSIKRKAARLLAGQSTAGREGLTSQVTEMQAGPKSKHCLWIFAAYFHQIREIKYWRKSE